VVCGIRVGFLLALVVPFSIATAGLDLLAPVVSCCDRYRGFCLGLYFLFSLTSVVRLRLDFLLPSLPRVYRAIFIFIVIDPCAGRHLLSLLRQRK
jgi:hypothetical protein